MRSTSNNRTNRLAINSGTECQVQHLATSMIHKPSTNSCYSSSKCAPHRWADLPRPATNHKVSSTRATGHLFRAAGSRRPSRCILSRLHRVISDINYSSQCNSNFHRTQRGTSTISHPSPASSSSSFWHNSRRCNNSRTNP